MATAARSRPLTDEEYAALTQQQRIALGLEEPVEAAPADFGGVVLPNPNHIRPMADTDAGIEPTRLPNGIQFQRGNFSGPMGADVSNPARAQLIAPEMQTAGSKSTGTPVSAVTNIDFSKYEQPTQIDFAKYEAGASGNKPPETHWYTGVGDTLQREVTSLGSSLASIPGATYHAFADEPTPEEKQRLARDKNQQPPDQIDYALDRMVVHPVQIAGDWYKQAIQGKIPAAYEQALDVAPEAVGIGASAPIAEKITSGITKTASDMSATKATAPVRAVVRATNKALEKAPRTVGAGVGGAVGAATHIPYASEVGAGIGATIGPEILPKIRIPGENIGLPKTVSGGPGLGEVPNIVEHPEAVLERPSVKPAQVEQQISEGLGGKLLERNVPLREQLPNAPKKPATPIPPKQGLPEGFTPADSTALKGYKYNPEAREMEAISTGGQHYVYGDVSPEQFKKFEAAESKGKAWNEIRQSGSPLVGKVLNGKRVAIKPTGPRTVEIDPGTGKPEFSDVLAKNASGESAASQEAINRTASEKTAGVKRVVVDTRSGIERPLFGPDAVDYQPRPYESVEFRGGTRDGEIIDQGRAVRPYRRSGTGKLIRATK